MRVTMLLFLPQARDAELKQFDVAPSMAEVEAVIGGALEQVPGFGSIDYAGSVCRCVALCRRDGKRLGLPLNVAATIMWDGALRREMGIGLIGANGRRADHLVGPVSVFFASPT